MNPEEHNQSGLEFVDAAAEIARSLVDRDEIMVAVAADYATLGLLDDALRATDEIGDPYSRDTAIANIAVNWVTNKPDTDPLSLIDSIEDLGNQNLALEHISVKYAEQNSFDTALEICHQLDDSDSALTRIIPIIAEKDSLEWSGELVREIDDLNARTHCFIELANIAKSKNQNSQATDFLLAAEAEAESEDAVEERIRELTLIADIYRELNEGEKAKEILRRAFQLCREFEGSPNNMLGKPFAKDRVLVQVARGFASCGDFAQSDLATAEIESPFQFGQAAATQAIEHHKAGQDSQALQILSEAGELVTSEEWPGPAGLKIRDATLMDLAFADAVFGHYQEALQKALLISNLEEQLGTLIDLGRNAAVAGLTESMFEIYEAVDSNYARALFLVTVSDALRQTDKTELAVRQLMMAIEQAEKIEQAEQKCLILIKIASKLSQSDLESKANEILSTVLSTTVDIKDGHQQARILLAMAEEYQRRGMALGYQEKEMLESIAGFPA